MSESERIVTVDIQGHRYPIRSSLEPDYIAEFDYQPGKCARKYRVVAVRKEVEVSRGQQKLFDDEPYFFYISNASPITKSARQIVFAANDRCDVRYDIHAAAA